MCVCVYVHVCMYERKQVSMCVYVCVVLCMQVCVCVSVCTRSVHVLYMRNMHVYRCDCARAKTHTHTNEYIHIAKNEESIRQITGAL